MIFDLNKPNLFKKINRLPDILFVIYSFTNLQSICGSGLTFLCAFPLSFLPCCVLLGLGMVHWIKKMVFVSFTCTPCHCHRHFGSRQPQALWSPGRRSSQRGCGPSCGLNPRSSRALGAPSTCVPRPCLRLFLCPILGLQGGRAGGALPANTVLCPAERSAARSVGGRGDRSTSRVPTGPESHSRPVRGFQPRHANSSKSRPTVPRGRRSSRAIFFFLWPCVGL